MHAARTPTRASGRGHEQIHSLVVSGLDHTQCHRLWFHVKTHRMCVASGLGLQLSLPRGTSKETSCTFPLECDGVLKKPIPCRSQTC